MSTTNLNRRSQYWVPKNLSKIEYVIDLKIDIDNKQVSGTETIVFKNSTHRCITEIAIKPPEAEEESLIELFIDNVLVKSVNTDGRADKNSPYFYILPKLLKPNESLELNVNFSFLIKEDAINEKLEEIQLNNFYPQLWWNYLKVFSNYKVKLNSLENWTVATSGKFDKEAEFYKNSGLKDFGIYLGKGQLIKETEVDGISIRSLYRDNQKECALFCHEAAIDIVKFYKNYYGFYPHNSISIYSGSYSFPAGGCPQATSLIYIHGMENFNDADKYHWHWITAHEIGHQYWGEYVTIDNNASDWLWIGLGIYLDREYLRHKNIDLKQYENFTNYYLEGLKLGNEAIADIPESIKAKANFDYNNILIHGKGFCIINMLESVVGKDNFDKACKTALISYANKTISYRDFQKICEDLVDENLSCFFERWIRTNDYLFYKHEEIVRKEKEGKFHSTVKVVSHGTMEMEIPVKIVFEDESEETVYTSCFDKINIFNFIDNNEIKEVIIDPDKKFPITNRNPYEWETDKNSYEKIVNNPDWKWNKETFDKVALYYKCEWLKEVRTEDGFYKINLALYANKEYKNALEVSKTFYDIAEKLDLEWEMGTYLVWIGRMYDLLDKRDEAAKHYNMILEKNIKGDNSEFYFGSSINFIDYAKERIKKPFERIDIKYVE